jgi:hypothetical protein
MKTREVFLVLRKHIEPPLLEMGFEPFKDPSGLFLVWTRPRKGRSSRRSPARSRSGAGIRGGDGSFKSS